MIWLSIALSAAYWLSGPWRPFPGSWLVKAAPVAILAVIAWRRGERGIAAALAMSAVGDALLELPNLFIGGLVAFLVAHLIYAVVFVRRIRRTRRAVIGAAAVVLYVALFSWWLVPQTGTIAPAVALYAAAIAAMAGAAFLAQRSEWGAILFVLSDSVLAVDRFAMPVRYAQWIIWPAYYVGQVLLSGRGRREAPRD